MTCVTCHNPHIPEGDGHDNAGSAENSCFICHESHDCGERPRLPESVQDRCIDCHMPRRMSINIWFATATNEYRPLLERRRHRIDVYPDATKQVLLDWYRHQDDAQSRLLADRLTQELFAQRVEEAEALRRDKRLFPASVAYREALQLRRSSEIEKKLSELMAALRQVDEAFEEAMTSINENRAGDAMRALERLLVIKPNDAQARGKLGLLLAENGQADEALSQLEIVTRYDPDSADGHVITGRIHYWQGRFHQAVDDYEKAAEKKPYDSLIHFELGSVLGKLQRFDDADRHLRRAIEINPNNDDAIQMLKRTLQTKRR